MNLSAMDGSAKCKGRITGFEGEPHDLVGRFLENPGTWGGFFMGRIFERHLLGRSEAAQRRWQTANSQSLAAKLSRRPRPGQAGQV